MDPAFAGTTVMDVTLANADQASGRLAENIVYFARALRAAGIPVGPGSVMDALEALRVAGISNRDDFYWTLHSVFVKRHEHASCSTTPSPSSSASAPIDQLMAMMLPQAVPQPDNAPASAAAKRVPTPCSRAHGAAAGGERETRIDAAADVSDREVLEKKDFAQMSAAEIAEAKQAIAQAGAAARRVKTRRVAVAPRPCGSTCAARCAPA